MSLASLLQMLLDFSERAAAIARTIRSDETLFKLLVEEKTGAEKNQRFQQDFKTLADVLIQQALSYQIQNQFPDLSDRVYGEECAVFNNAVGESIIVKVHNTQHETASLLSKVLDGNTAAADVLAHEVHKRDIKSGLRIDADVVSVPLSQLAIWIDPIDSTAEYIRGNDCASNSTGSTHLDMDKGSLETSSTSVCLSGLSCVTVLLGVFRYNDGAPVAGVVCQPFGEHSTDGGYRSRVWWGAASGSSSLRCDQALCRAPLSRVCVSSTEVPAVLAALTNAGVEVVPAAGAGYKALLVITGHVQAYICTKGSTYEWDSCGPHSILLSHGGGIVPYSSLAQFRHVPPPDTRNSQLRYTPRSEAGAAPHCNRGGLVAYHSHHHLLALAELLADVVLS